jgi:hypothetical protein
LAKRVFELLGGSIRAAAALAAPLSSTGSVKNFYFYFYLLE